MKIKILFIAFFVLAMFIFSKESQGAAYYEGKVIKIIVGSEPGGGYDRMARLLAKHISKYIPGRPSIVVENMPGAGGLITANFIYNIAKPDGLTIGAPQRGMLFAQLLGAEGVKFDVTKYSWIGSPDIVATVLCIRSDLPYKTFDDLRKAKETIYVAGEGPGTTDYQFPTLLKEFLGLNLKMVNYPSGTAGLLAVERKEVDGKAGTYGSLKPYIERGLLRPLIRGRISVPEIENLPVNEDLATDKKAKTIMAMLSAGNSIGRPYVAPPGTPSDVMNILRDAFVKVFKDPDFKEDAKKNRIEAEYVTTDECLKVVNYIFNQPEDIVKEFSKYVQF